MSKEKDAAATVETGAFEQQMQDERELILGAREAPDAVEIEGQSLTSIRSERLDAGAVDAAAQAKLEAARARRLSMDSDPLYVDPETHAATLPTLPVPEEAPTPGASAVPSVEPPARISDPPSFAGGGATTIPQS